jgi:cell division protein FtsB
MMGQAPPCGTGVVHVRLDEEKFSKYTLQAQKVQKSQKVQKLHKIEETEETEINNDEYCDTIDFEFDA